MFFIRREIASLTRQGMGRSAKTISSLQMAETVTIPDSIMISDSSFRCSFSLGLSDFSSAYSLPLKVQGRDQIICDSDS